MIRNIKRTTIFKRDYRREKRTDAKLDDILFPVVKRLACDEPLDARFCDHSLGGDLKNIRDCHIKPNLVMLYSKPDEDTLVLVRLGSHSELNI